MLTSVEIGRLSFDRFEQILSADRYEEVLEAVERGRRIFDGRVVWNVNSTARGGGVAEMLASLLAYAKGAGVDARWLAIPGDPAFFSVTKRIHNNLHSDPGDGGELGDADRAIYEKALAPTLDELVSLVGERDVVLVHDPQPAGLIPGLKQARGVPVIWRCHVGIDEPTEVARRAWRFLSPYVEHADAFVFSRESFVWEGLDEAKIALIAPVIDAFSPKNQALDDATVQAILAAAGLCADSSDVDPTFMREDGTTGRVEHAAQTIERQPLGREPCVLQVSRWDRLKDPLGVIRGFVEHVAPETDAHLVYAGPSVDAVSDDPEGAAVLDEARALALALPEHLRSRVHLACLPMDDIAENAAIVNALQRRADVVVQKSVAEGFGLTVAEAMWKAKPVVASRIGGIQDQIIDGESGLLIDDPSDLRVFGEAVRSLLVDPQRARQMGEEAQRRVRDDFLAVRGLLQYLDLIERLVEPR